MEIVQEARRAADSAFTFSAQDLTLPLQLFNLRQQYRADPDANARLDEAFQFVLAGDLPSAQAILDSLPAKP